MCRPCLHGRLRHRLVRGTGEGTPGRGEMARPAHDLDVRPTPLVTAEERTHGKGLTVEAFLALGDAPVRPAGVAVLWQLAHWIHGVSPYSVIQ